MTGPESIKQRSREALRLQITRGTEEEVWSAFEELMRRNMEVVPFKLSKGD